MALNYVRPPITDPTFSQSKGLIGFEIEGGGVVKISHRNVWLKTLP